MDIVRSIDLFEEMQGGGDIKLFGGEPLLRPDLVRFAMEESAHRAKIHRIYLSTNGLGLTEEWIEYLRKYPKGILTLSMDGRPEDHRRMRRTLPGIADSYDHVVSILPQLIQVPRLVVTQTIAPATAGKAMDNFRHLIDLGFRRFNFLPGYFIPWRSNQLDRLRASFDAIASTIESFWREGKYLYVRNLFVRAPTPFFNSGLIVDSDRSIHPSNLGLSASLDHLREQTLAGNLDNPPSKQELEDKSREVNSLLKRELPEKIWNSTMAADEQLSLFCRRLLPSFLRYRRQKEIQVA